MPTLTWFVLLAAYGLSFMLQNKADFLYSEEYRETGAPNTFLDRLLYCTFCLSAHCGLVLLLVFSVLAALSGPAPHWTEVPRAVLVWWFAAGAFGYGLDAAIQWLERGGSAPEAALPPALFGSRAEARSPVPAPDPEDTDDW